MTGAWRNATPNPTQAPPMPTGYPIVQVSTTGISKGALAGGFIVMTATIYAKLSDIAILFIFSRDPYGFYSLIHA